MAKAILTGRLIGAETIVGDIRRYGDTIRAKLRATVQQSAQELAGLAASIAPRNTGALASSIKAVGIETDKKILASIGTDIKHGMAYYGRFQESGWTPNPRRTFNSAGESVERAGWKRNPRKAKDWRDYSRKHGTRRIVANPFLKPALAQLRGRIRERMLAVVRGEG